MKSVNLLILKSLVVCSMIGGAISSTAVADEAEAAALIHKKSRLVFASKSAGTKHLRQADRFTKVMSEFDLQSRVGRSKDVSMEDYLTMLGDQTLEWESEEKQKIANAFAVIREKIKGFNLPFPDEVVLIKTTGREEGEAAYCRTNAIILPTKMVAWQGTRLERLLTHELFHVLSSHNPELRTRMYAIVGFKTVDAIRFPKELASRKITNPDAPTLDSVIELKLGKENVWATPVLFAKREFDDTRNDSFFAYMTFRLMVVGQEGDEWVAVKEGGEIRLLDPRKTASYGDQIGANTGYIIHPDEIMADNFVHMVHRTEGLRNPRIIRDLEKLLTGN